MEVKTCQECEMKIYGRADKKFCSDHCRTAYNNKINSTTNNFVRQVNATLRRNRRILMTLNPHGKITTHRDKLVERGFDFKYFTNTYKTKAGAVYFFCYEYGYMETGNNFFVLVRKD